MCLTVDYETEEPGTLGPGKAGQVLAEIDHGPSHERGPDAPWRLSVGLERLSGPHIREVWRVPAVRDAGWEDGIGWVEGDDLLFAHVLAHDDGGADPAALTGACYTRILGLLDCRGFPHPLRMWSFLPAIHRRVGGLERYRGFCVGRDRAFREGGLEESGFPAATAIGSSASGLLVYLLAGRQPGRPVENPRQVSAYRYPPRYGPRPPSFARGMRLPESGPGSRTLLVSGTASVVGHRSRHPGDVLGQLRETLANLESVAAAAGLDGRWTAGDTPPLLKVFLREPNHRETVSTELERWSRGRARVLYLQGAVCREELAIEIEGVL
jgi:chorismate lyase/3-hydroxybenzoate synthase